LGARRLQRLIELEPLGPRALALGLEALQSARVLDLRRAPRLIGTQQPRVKRLRLQLRRVDLSFSLSTLLVNFPLMVRLYLNELRGRTL
jgi:hypothetical protein